jgi:hypothetical protein
MAYPTNKRGALLALALSGGLWAWQNRDKITGWLQKQQAQGGAQPLSGGASSTGNQYGGNASTQTAPGGGSYTGATRRMTESDSPFRQGTMEGNEGRNSEI